jgi:hypothetical protein
MSTEEEDAADGRGDNGEHQHAKRDDGKREEEEGSRMDAFPKEILEAVLLATYTRGANPSAAALVPLLFVCRRWNAIVRPHAVDGAKVMEWAAGEGHLALVEWLEGNACPFDDRRLCDIAAEGGHLEVLRWAKEQGCPWNEQTCTAAAEGGHLEVLSWAREQGCHWHEWTCAYAARGGHLEVLRWAIEQGCPWDESTCDEAARGGHLEVLRWAREQGCPWDEWTCASAARGGHLEVLRWAREQGSPWNATHCMRAAKCSEVADYIALAQQMCAREKSANKKKRKKVSRPKRACSHIVLPMQGPNLLVRNPNATSAALTKTACASPTEFEETFSFFIQSKSERE